MNSMLLSPARSVGSPECKTLRQMSFEEAVPYLLKDQKSQEQWSTPELVNDSDLDAMEKYPFLLSGFQPEIHEDLYRPLTPSTSVSSLPSPPQCLSKFTSNELPSESDVPFATFEDSNAILCDLLFGSDDSTNALQPASIPGNFVYSISPWQLHADANLDWNGQQFQHDNLMAEWKNPEGHLQCLWANCNATFSSLAALGSHLEGIHVPRRKSLYACQWHQCSRFQQPFTKRHKIISHLRTHTGERPFRCTVEPSVCSRTFTRLDALMAHKRVHTNVKMYQCSEAGCSRTYFHARSLRKHLKAHLSVAE